MDIKRKYTILAFLLVCFTLSSCIDDDLTICEDDFGIPAEITKGLSLNLTVTLDKMGGTTRGIDPMSSIDDYIDPEKFRVLFFAGDNKIMNDEDEEVDDPDNDKFLFESKSRWIKQLGPNETGLSQWIVSVPMYEYGNDKEENWNWAEIRKFLTTKKFKIAILANRPLQEYCPQFDTEDSQIEEHWFDNTYPHWNVDDTLWPTTTEEAPEGQGSKHTVKKIFDLHHCQPDPIYEGKNYTSKVNEGYYNFIQGEKMLDTNDGKYYPSMGSTSSWVDWNVVGTSEEQGVSPKDYASDFPSENTGNTEYVRYTILPDTEHPIPMYGIQEFEPISGWSEGTPFNLSDFTTGHDAGSGYEYRTIGLLRSLVKLELLIPKSYSRPKFVAMWYSNIYARCEPMDVWTPTDKLWKENSPHDTNCEWKDIMDYGPICYTNTDAKYGIDAERKTDDAKSYQKSLAWFYGRWLEKGWEFWTYDETGQTTKTEDETFLGNVKTKYGESPQIFNPCIQRNKLIMCNVKGDVSDLYNDDYWHFVVYTGERNMIDPNTLPSMTGNAYSATWTFKDEDTGYYYCFPIADYSGKNGETLMNKYVGPYESKDFVSREPTSEREGELQPPKKDDNTLDMKGYGNNIKNGSETVLPWPLLRNHVYTITVGGATTPIKSWNFTNLSEETLSNMQADNSWWAKDTPTSSETAKLPKYQYTQWYNNVLSAAETKLLTANNQIIAETEKLRFGGFTSAKSINFENVYKENENDQEYKYYLRLNSGGTTITFPRLKNGQTITIVCKFPVTGTLSADEDRFIKAVGSELIPEKGEDDVKTIGSNGERYVLGYNYNGAKDSYKFKWTVKTSSTDPVPVEFTLNSASSKGIAILKAWIDDAGEDTNGARTTRAQKGSQLNGFSVKSEDYYSRSLTD